ncbi:hypothetical protein BH18THE2_BH18THE2_43790 [soil metagenome]
MYSFRNPKNYLKITSALVIGIIVTMVTNQFVDISHPISAQTNSSGNMEAPMMESARFHLRAADELLMEGNTVAALDQIDLAEIQLSLLNMGSQETTMNQTQAMELVIGGSLSSMKMAANCIIDSQAMVRCM